MKLIQKHIQKLYKFTRKHYVEYYDVQTELVDHLANDIEQIWKENPNLSFEDARDKSFKKFGIFGFMDVVQAKESQMTKKYFKLVLKFTKEWFQLPKILATILLFSGFYVLQDYQFGTYIYYTIFAIVMFLQIISMIVNGIKLKKKYQKTGKKWLFENMINVNGMANIFVLLFWFFDFPFNNSKDFLLMGNFRKFLSAFLITILVLVAYITLIVIPKKATQLLQETYPEYKFV
ncbi:hypothetical protein [Polaribacter sp.]|uniref:hypothetical protein n=1 Tax=Polaribacter sp. TaxID=1920175 RepID=UPI003F6AC5E3